MKPMFALIFAATLAAPPLCLAADAAKHDEHHPDTAAKPIKAAQAASTPKAASGEQAKRDAQMKVMRDMHEKMMAAKTPEERNALMAEHMKTMQDGMAMMNGMMGGMMGGRASSQQPMPPQMMQKQMESMQKQMDMMRMMMQMMMDRMGAQTPAK